MNTHDPLPTRASLLDRLKDVGDDASWEEFHRTYHGLLLGMARRKRTLELNVAQAYLAKHRVGAALKKELQRLRKTEI